MIRHPSFCNIVKKVMMNIYVDDDFEQDNDDEHDDDDDCDNPNVEPD